MKSFYAIAALQALAAVQALPSAPAPSASPGIYILTAARGDDKVITGLKVEAAGFGFNLGSAGPATYCPTFVTNCPPGNETVLAGGLSPITEVPGGQQGYVAPDGKITYTQAHSTYYPPGSYFGGWTWTAGPQTNRPTDCNAGLPQYYCDIGTGIFTFKSPDEEVGGVYACPSPNSNGGPFYTLYAKTPGYNQTDCLELDGLVSHTYTGPNPNTWQYT